jgi:predicted DNA-binding protein
MEGKSMLKLQLEPEAEALLEEQAAKAGQTKAEFARRAILDRLEDCEDYETGVAALREAQSAVPFEEVVKSLGMEAEFPPKGTKAAARPGQGHAKTNPQVPARKATRIA